MKTILKILQLQDPGMESDVIANALLRAELNVDIEIAGSPAAFIEALDKQSFDVILYNELLPLLSALEALDILKDKKLNIPFIMIASPETDCFATALFRNGAADYVSIHELPTLAKCIDDSLEKFTTKSSAEKRLRGFNSQAGKYEALSAHSLEAVMILSAEGKPLHVSAGIKNVLGYTPDEIMHIDPLLLAHPDDLVSLGKVFGEVLAKPGIPVQGHTGRMLHKDKSWRWIEATVTNMLHDPSINGIIDNFRDVTAQKIANDRIIQLNRLSDFISQINHTISHSTNQKEVFEKVCRIAITVGKFEAAWISLFDVENKQMQPAESAGIDAEDLAKFMDVPYGENTPQARVSDTKQYYVCNDINQELRSAEWKAWAAASSYGSYILLPIKKAGAVVGTFNLCASTNNFFTKNEIALLEEATGDLSFAVELFEKQYQKLQADNLVKRREWQLRQAQAIAHLGSWELDVDTGIAEWSDEMLRIYGLPATDYKQSWESWISFIHPDDVEAVTLSTSQARATTQTADCQHRIICRDGSVRYMHSWIQIEPADKHNGERLHGVGYDVTEMIDAEASIQEYAANLQAIFQSTSEGIILTDKTGMVKSFNKKAADMMLVNYDKEVKAGTSMYDYVAHSRRAIFEKATQKALSGHTVDYDYTSENKDEAVIWYNIKLFPVYLDGIINGISITAADITARKLLEESSLRAASNLKAIVENTDAFIYSLDRNFRYITFNSAVETMMHQIYAVTIFPGYDVFDFINAFDPESAAEWNKNYTTALNGEIVKFEKEYQGSNGSTYTSFSIHPIWENNEVIGVSCFVNDVTKQKQHADELKQSELRYRQMIETAQEGIWMIDEHNRTTFVNKKMCELLGYSEEEMLGKDHAYFMNDAGKLLATETLERRKKGIKESFDTSLITKNGREIWTTISANPIFDEDGNYKGALGMVSDITDKTKLKNLLDKTNEMVRIGSWEVDLAEDNIFWSAITKQIHEVPPDFTPNLKSAINLYTEGRSREMILAAVTTAIEKGTPYDLELQVITPENPAKWVRTNGEAEMINGKCQKLYGSFQDIDKRKKAELEILRLYEEKNNILESIGDGFFALDTNWVVTYWNNQAESMMQVSKAVIVGKKMSDIFPQFEDSLAYQKYQAAMKTRQIVHFEEYYESSGNWFEISAFPSDHGVSVYFKNITESKALDIKFKKLNEELQQHAKELSSSNQELEQFAYVASHDLQEPLRMITSFLARIENKYTDLIDDKGKQYIHFAMDGAKRMRQIILDLLEFSRVGQKGGKAEDVDVNELLEEILSLLRRQIAEKKALVKVTKLPLIKTLKSPLRQVFQNLISNSLLYHKGTGNEISIAAEEFNTHWQFSVTDKGIGIAAEYYDKIFTIFQRLHNRDDYSGTGIGLAISKKIVEGMGGKIWVESTEGKGSTFYFTLPK